MMSRESFSEEKFFKAKNNFHYDAISGTQKFDKLLERSSSNISYY